MWPVLFFLGAPHGVFLLLLLMFSKGDIFYAASIGFGYQEEEDQETKKIPFSAGAKVWQFWVSFSQISKMSKTLLSLTQADKWNLYKYLLKIRSTPFIILWHWVDISITVRLTYILKWWDKDSDFADVENAWNFHFTIFLKAFACTQSIIKTGAFKL